MNMTEITVEELEKYFEEYLDRVEGGETFLVKSSHGDVMLMPVDEYDDMVRMSTGLTE